MDRVEEDEGQSGEISGTTDETTERTDGQGTNLISGGDYNRDCETGRIRTGKRQPPSLRDGARGLGPSPRQGNCYILVGVETTGVDGRERVRLCW